MFQDLERNSVAKAELALGMRIQRACRAVEKTQPDPIAHGKLQDAMVGIVVALGDLLCLEEAFPDLCQELIALAEMVDNIREWHPLCRAKGRWRPPIYHLE
jgi:hypothetical protein